jgi:glutamate synthase domain-containing protein 3
VPGEGDADELRSLLGHHLATTGSVHARRLLEEWPSTLQSFWKVIPRASIAARAVADPEAQAEPEPSRGVAD